MSETEAGLWDQAIAAGRRGEVASMLDALEKLPPEGYPARVPLLLAHMPALLADTRLGGRAVALLGGLTSVEARALRQALEPVPAEDVVEVAVAYATEVGLGSAPAEAIRDGHRLPAVASSAPAMWLYDTYLAGLSGTNLDDRAASLDHLARPLLDDLIDARALTRGTARTGVFGTEAQAYLRCRTQPGTADRADLEAAGFGAEQARRAYLARDREWMTAIGADDDPDVRHYRALLAYVLDRDRTGLDDLRPVTRAAVELIEAAGDVPAELAADRSSWPLLREPALLGKLSMTDAVRAAHPDFARWFDLVALTWLVYEQKWAEAVRDGRALQGTNSSDEIVNLVAYANWQLGHVEDAVVELTEAGTTTFHTGLLLNASVVAGTIGSTAALEPLARVVREAPDPRIRDSALRRAIVLWLTDDDVAEYPAELADLVHSALSGPVADDTLYQQLIMFTANNDAAWLAGAAVHFDNAAQADLMRYFQARARVLDDEGPETFVDLARVLVAIWGRRPRPEWITRERDRLVTMLDELVHRTFGAAVALTSVIRVLLDGGVLELPDRLVLSAQAGAHLAAGIEDDDPLGNTERHLLFEPVNVYLYPGTQLSGPDRKRVGEELARCLVMAAVSVTNYLVRATEGQGEAFNDLVRRRAWDHDNLAAIRTEQWKLLDLMGYAATRMRSYLMALQQLPLADTMSDVPEQVRSRAESLSAQVERLRGGV